MKPNQEPIKMATRPKSRIPLNTPYRGAYGTPLAHVQYRQGRHMNPERIPFQRNEKPVTVRLLDVSIESLENLRRVAASIKRLLVPSLKLQTVPELLVAYLEHLERLDLSHNQLTDSSFPDAMKVLEQLVELRLNDNQLTRIPPCLKRMRNLSRLDLSNNQLDTISGLDKLKKMQLLVLDDNRLGSVFKDISGLRKLETLRCSNNSIRDVPREIRNLRQLKDLDLSNNRIGLLPIDVFQLPRLQCLNASQNQIGKIPSFSVKAQNKHWISSVDLSDNNLVKFPGHLLQFSRKLDLSSNKIHTLSWSSLKRLDWDGGQNLLLDANPLSFPPLDVCQSGLRSILQFFLESQAEVKTYQGVKILVIGSHRSGKSSLVHSLVDQQARLSDDATDTAVGVDAYEMSFDYDVEDGRPGKSLNLCLWDFCGNPFYLYPHYIFHEQPSITILTFSLPDYSPDKFSEEVGSWFDWMIAKTNKLVVILVGTKSDKVKARRAAAILRDVRDKLARHLQQRHWMIERRMKQIEKRPVISPTLSEDLKAYMKLLQAKFFVQTEVLLTSSKSFLGFDKLRKAVENLASDRKLFPNVMRVIPTFWVEVENWVEERGNALVVPVMSWQEFSEEVSKRFQMKHLLISITQYLHESGKVLWFSNIPSLKEMVFLRPAWLFDVLKQIFRHDLESVTFTPDETLKNIAFTTAKFERLKQEVLSDGVIDKEFIKGLLVSLLPADDSQLSTEVVRILTEGLEMAYPLSKRPRSDASYDFSVEKDSEGKLKISKLLIPWFRRSAEPLSFHKQWTELQDRRHLAVQIKFPCYMPPGLFELLTVRAHAEKHKLVFLAHWGGGIHARHSEEKVQLLIMYYRERVQEQECEGDGDFDDCRCEEETSAVAAEEAETKSKGRHNIGKIQGQMISANTSTFSQSADQTATQNITKGSRVSMNSFEGHGSCKPRTVKALDSDSNSVTIPANDEFLASNSKNPGTGTSDTDSSGLERSSPVGNEGHNPNMARTTGKLESCRQKTPITGNQEEDRGSVVLKLEVRDNSPDIDDQTPASSMWNILLPLLMDFEELLQRYAGVLVERRTECPFCGDPAFLGEWLTPKETQGLNTRTCDSCNQQVDTAFLVQPREKKRDEVMRALIRRTVRRRGAAVTSDIDDIHRIAPLSRGRTAIVPFDSTDIVGLQELVGNEIPREQTIRVDD